MSDSNGSKTAPTPKIQFDTDYSGTDEDFWAYRLKLRTENISSQIQQSTPLEEPFLITGIQEEKKHFISGSSSSNGSINNPFHENAYKSFESSYLLQSFFRSTGEVEEVESSSKKRVQLKNIEKAIKQTFELARDEVIEDGMESHFSKDLESYVRMWGSIATNIIGKLIMDEEVNFMIASEALRFIGDIEDPETYNDRLICLLRCLDSNYTIVRDGAALGLAAIDDPVVIPYIKNTIKKEKVVELREDLWQILDQLENTKRCQES